MATIETITFTPDQFLTLMISLLGAIAGATYWITRKISGVEKDIEHVLKNSYVKALMDFEGKHAKETIEKLFDKTLNTWEAEKKVPSEVEEDTSKK